MYQAAIITASDKGASGKRKDESGAVVRQMLEEAGYAIHSQRFCRMNGNSWQKLCASSATTMQWISSSPLAGQGFRRGM